MGGPAILALPAVMVFTVTLAAPAAAISIEFAQPYDSSRTHRAGPVHATADGGYFTVGTLLESTWRAMFIKTDAFGNPLRSGIVASFYLVNSAVPMEDGGYCLGGFNQSSVVKLIRIDSLGTTLWSRTYDPGQLRSLERTSDGGFIGVGRVGIGTSEDLYLLRLDASGNVLWQRTYDLTMTSYAGQDIVETPDGGFMVATNQLYGSDTQILFMRTNGAGDSLWTRVYGDPGLTYVTGLVRGAGDTYVATGQNAGDTYLLELDATGAAIWERGYDAGGDDQGMGLYRLPAGGYRVCGWAALASGEPHHIQVLELTETGDTTWTRVFGGAGDDQPRAIGPAPDGGYIVASRTQSFPLGEDHFYLVKGSAGASFTASPRSGEVPLTVQFTDHSIGSPTGWSWDFDGDGDTDATVQHPAHTYTSQGNYDVRLIAQYGSVRDTVIHPGLVQATCAATTVFPGFTDVTPPSLQIIRNRLGAAWGDYDSDGYPDLLVSGQSGALFHNDAGAGFTEVGLSAEAPGGGAWADFDRDGDLDLFVSSTGASRLYRNDGGSLISVSMPPVTNSMGSLNRTGSSWADYDRDGDPDLFVVADNGSSSLFRNDSTSGFVDASAIGLGDPGGAYGVAWVDYDNDGDPDVAIGRVGQQNRLERNNNGSSFTDVTAGSMADPGDLRGVAWGDYDNDGDFDLFVCNASAASRLYRNNGGTFSVASGVPDVASDGAAWGDFDNDGDLDLFLAAYPGNALLRNDGGTFVNATVASCAPPSDFGPGLACADYDRDGDLDVFLSQWGAPCRLLRNDAGPGRWLELKLRGGRSDRNGIGARMRVRTGSISRMREIAAGSGYLSQDDLTAHFGLGTAALVDSVIVRWPSGIGQVLTHVATNQILQLTEPDPSYEDTVTVVPVLVTTISNPVAEVPVVHRGSHSLGVVALVFEYDSAKLSFNGVQSRVPGETFTAGMVGGKISVQWFDETLGADPIQPSEDTLFVLRLTCNGANTDSSRITIDRSQSGIGDPSGNPLTSVLWQDLSPYGWVRVDLGASVAGRVGYFWQDRNVPRAVLSLGGSIPDQPSAADGTYGFGGLSSGNYTLSVLKTTDLDGINSLDAIKVVRHGSGVEPLGDPNKELAANVNGDGLINAFDAIKIVRAAVGLEPLPSGDWRFVPASRTYAPLNSNLTGQNFTAIRMGDANGDWMPSTGSAPAAQAEAFPSSAPTLALPTTEADGGAPSVDIPLDVTGFTGIGAVSLRIGYAPAVLAYVSTISQVSGVSFTANAVGGEIRIEWFDGTGGGSPINLGSGTLLMLRMDPVGAAGEASPLHFRSVAVGDAAGNPIPGVTTTDGQVTLVQSAGVPSADGSGWSLAPPYPNPTQTRMTVDYGIPAHTHVHLAVYDVRGHLVRTLVADERDPGRHRSVWDLTGSSGSAAPPGLYFLRLRAGGRTFSRRILLLGG